MILMKEPAKALLLASCLSVFLSACTDQGPATQDLDALAGQGELLIDPAETLPFLRMIDTEALQIQLLVNNSEVGTQRDAQGRWRTTINVPPGTQLALRTSIGLDNLLLAQSNLTFPIARQANAIEITIPPSSFNTNFDEDGDRLSNLFEFENDLAPRNPGIPGESVVDVGIRLRFEQPEALNGLDRQMLGPARLEASLNGQTLQLSLQDNALVAEATVVENSQAFVEATWFLDSPTAVAIAKISRSDSVGSGVEITYVPGSYSSLIDDDLDGVINASELRLQSDPSDAGSVPDNSAEPGTVNDGSTEVPPSNEQPDSQPMEEPMEQPMPEAEQPADPAEDACAISVFEEGCDNDFDRDGIPDSVEGQDADADDDSIPDWMESAVTDADGDEITAQFDGNEEDPCSPDPNSRACTILSSDADGDGKLDIEEGDGDRDGDGKLDVDESSIDDADDDGTPDEEDPDDSDPCNPRPTRVFCN